MTTSTYSAFADDLTTGALMPTARLFGAYLAEARYELVRILRLPGFVAPFLLLPVALYLFFGVVLFGNGKEPDAAVYIFTGFAIFGVMGPGMFGFGIFVATEREQGLLTLKRALPMPPACYLLARMLMTVLFATLIMATMIAAAATIGHLRLTAAQFCSLALVNVLGSLPFCALGLFIGTHVSAKSAPAFVNLLYLPMIYLSGFFFQLPQSIRWIEFASPAFYLNQLARKSVGMAAWGPPALHLFVLVGITLLLGVSAVRRLARVG